jgi:peptidoglycan/xylan/chitin deacetylase (PgdA/CDA1 family)
VGLAVATLAVTLWTGANSPAIGWFGTTVSHGPRDSGEVALTFDDGPNANTTLALASILEDHGARGTFFSVGKAVDARPDITKDLVARGHLVGNHSYLHDSIRWLDPRYPELGRAERTIAARADVCPAFFRPPHGQHTPFMARTVRRADMTMVTWDVSASDWSVDDPAKIAEEVLRRVRPGSIVDLHDGLDGRVDVDRTVLLRAVPLILDGLAARGLDAVRLDVLLRRPGYLAHC